MWQRDVAEDCKTCDRCQKENNSTGKRLGNMIKLHEPSRPWEIVHMGWVDGLPPGGDRGYNSCLVIATDLVRLQSSYHVTRMIQPSLWTNLHQLFGKKLSFSTAYHPQTDGLAERMIQTLEDMKSIHASTNQTPSILEKGWNPKLPQDSLRKELAEIHPTAASFKGMLDKAIKHAVRCMEDSFAYSKDKWDKSHTTPDFKVGDLVLVSTTNFNNIKECKNLKDSFSGRFVIKALHGENDV
ncbi:hypothetical protein O181_070852 [Austropuccinia psidii MF-1]|uniref:Integrase catalytic domain-containing protein n=1 Tax=Austropuccinia psidii MF-1 TaxID=1389203 RepID=A0A9Q3F6Q5_9BASI|nr:hypothetical protein [Austropuccinia psidii MF-1]